ncbi:VanW family protein [Hoyosella altamirensis]|uniref:Vancomycin resistance protein YoaR n=1 Tax=Hoyosella altamirensis TaxID=616997 RepID=A0A839RK73_9ACTN|nr:VanW family protein [Hoyosella altamirensis]MBB3036628.1 vancomycin resistance protein YoaR [Hoyosella altamirensis]
MTVDEPDQPAPEEPAPDDSDGSQESDGTPRRRHTTLLVAAAIFVLAGVVYGVDLFAAQGKVARDVTVLGVHIGGLDPARAESRLAHELGALASAPVTVEAGDVTTDIVPVDAGLDFDWPATVATAQAQSLNPVTRVLTWVRERPIPPEQAVDEDTFNATVTQLTEDVNRAPREGGIEFRGPEPEPIYPEEGQELNVVQARQSLLSGWYSGATLTLPVTVAPVSVTRTAVDAAMDKIALPAVAEELVIEGADGATARLARDQVGEVLTFEPDGQGGLDHEFDEEAAREILVPQLAETERGPRDATVVLGNLGPYVVRDEAGREIDWDETLDGFADLMLETAGRTRDAVYEEIPAEFTTADADGLGIDEVVAEFTTGGFTANSGHNIRRAAQQVNGAVVKPGETFSLNGHTGPRGLAQGYIRSGVIYEGRPDEAIGGGVSQFATTLYNAGYFAGMEDVEHQEHSYYISRYPAGREATVWEGAIDVKFRNPYPTGVLIESFGDGANVTVRLWGTKTVDVESINGGRWNQTEPQRLTLPAGPNCAPSSGAPGFTTSDTRVIRNAATGAEISRQTRTVVYEPQPIVVCR